MHDASPKGVSVSTNRENDVDDVDDDPSVPLEMVAEVLLPLAASVGATLGADVGAALVGNAVDGALLGWTVVGVECCEASVALSGTGLEDPLCCVMNVPTSYPTVTHTATDSAHMQANATLRCFCDNWYEHMMMMMMMVLVVLACRCVGACISHTGACLMQGT